MSDLSFASDHSTFKFVIHTVLPVCPQSSCSFFNSVHLLCVLRWWKVKMPLRWLHLFYPFRYQTGKRIWNETPNHAEESGAGLWGDSGCTKANESRFEKTTSTQVTYCVVESEPVSGNHRDGGLSFMLLSRQVMPMSDWPMFLDMAWWTLTELLGSCHTLVLCVTLQQPSL